MSKNSKKLGESLKLDSVSITNKKTGPTIKEAEGSYALVPITLISPDPDQPRKEFEPDQIQSLSLSLSRNGLRQPINVRRVGEGGFMIVEGERRWRAAKLLGWDHIKSIIDASEGQGASDRLLAQRAENQDRSNLTLWEDCQACDRYTTISRKKAKDAASDLGISPIKLSKMRKLLKAPDEVKSLARLDICTNLNTLGTLADLHKLSSEETAREINNIIEAGEMPPRSESYFSDQLKQLKSPSPDPEPHPQKKTQTPDNSLLETSPSAESSSFNAVQVTSVQSDEAQGILTFVADDGVDYSFTFEHQALIELQRFIMRNKH